MPLPMARRRALNSFSIAEIPPKSLEQVLSKWKAYCRLQQTCQDIKEFVQARGTVHVDWTCMLEIETRDENFLQLYADIRDEPRWLGKPPNDSLYGVRFGVVYPSPDVESHFDEFCKALKKYGITADVLIMDRTDRSTTLSKEHCIDLFKVLKPSRLNMSSIGSNRFEAIDYCKNLKQVTVSVHPDQALAALQKLVGRFEQISLNVDGAESFSLYEIRHVVMEFLQFVHTNELPSRHSFFFFAPCSERIPSIEVQMAWFREFNPTIQRTCGILDDAIDFQCKNGSPCKLIMARDVVKIICG